VAANEENDALLFQLQVMFAYLRLSQKSFYDTLPFCRSFKDYDGQPVSLREQKDINEFAGRSTNQWLGGKELLSLT
jgi:hypothetical protein